MTLRDSGGGSAKVLYTYCEVVPALAIDPGLQRATAGPKSILTSGQPELLIELRGNNVFQRTWKNGQVSTKTQYGVLYTVFSHNNLGINCQETARHILH